MMKEIRKASRYPHLGFSILRSSLWKSFLFLCKNMDLFFVFIHENRKDVGKMSRNMRLFALLTAAVLWLSCTGALAEFSPRYERLAAGEGMALTVSGQLENLSPLGAQSLEIVNGWLDGLEFTVTEGQNTSVRIVKNGESLLSASVNRQAGYTLTAFQPSGSVYLTDPAGPDALTLITGDEVAIPDFSKLPLLYRTIAPSLYAALEKYVTPKKVKEATSIKNASAAASYVNYQFQDGKLNEAWPDALEAVLPALKEALSDQPALYAQTEELLRALEFSGECRFKRFLDKEGNDLGLQFTGRAAKDGDNRKVTLFGGYTPDKGGYVSLTLAGVGSKNSLKFNLGVKLTAKKNVNTLTLEGSLNRVLDGKTTAYTLNASLKNEIKEESEHWTGKITLAGTENKVKTTWTLTPDLMFDESGLEGNMTVQRKTGSAVSLKAKAHVRLTSAGEEGYPAALSAKDLRGLTRERARTAVLSELVPLTGAIASLTANLTEDERTLLLHELRTDEWMNGPSVPVQTAEQQPSQENTDDSWVVEEDEQ